MSDRYPPLSEDEARDLEQFKPIRISLVRDPEGRWLGVVEHSMAMGTDRERVNIWWSGEAYSILGKHVLNAIDDTRNNPSTLNGEIFDPFDPACPVEINWSYWLRALREEKRGKFDKRNAPFAVREEFDL